MIGELGGYRLIGWVEAELRRQKRRSTHSNLPTNRDSLFPLRYVSEAQRR